MRGPCFNEQQGRAEAASSVAAPKYSSCGWRAQQRPLTPVRPSYSKRSSLVGRPATFARSRSAQPSRSASPTAPANLEGAIVAGSRWALMQKRAILFDIDGTLVDSNDAHVEAWQRAFTAEGFAFTRSQIHAQVGKGADNLVPSLVPDVTDDVQDRLAQAQGEIYKSEFLADVQPFDGAKIVLRRLAEAGQTLLLASSASRAEVDYYIELLDAEGLLSGSTSNDDVPRSKPCPDIFTAALALAGVTADKAVVVGDTPYDILGARRAGLDAIAVLSGGFDRSELASCKPLAIYEDVRGLVATQDAGLLAVDQDVRA